jgi:hypothetical protein
MASSGPVAPVCNATRLIHDVLMASAVIPATFTTARTDDFDLVYMKALFTRGFEMTSAPSGSPWDASPPGWLESDAAKILGSRPVTEPRTR